MQTHPRVCKHLTTALALMPTLFLTMITTPVCKNVIQRLNGTVNIESIPGEGTSIIIKVRGRMRAGIFK